VRATCGEKEEIRCETNLLEAGETWRRTRTRGSFSVGRGRARLCELPRHPLLDQLRAARLARGESLESLAYRTGYSVSSIRRRCGG
jgi:hypothetical protein